jgi:large subunit ribosomal protein L9
MKVILNEEVPGLGLPGKIVDVAPGYARNYLVPRKLAVYASRSSVKELAHHAQRLERKKNRLMTAAMGTQERLTGKTIVMDLRSGKEGKLFGSVTNVAIADAIKTAFEIEVDRRRITMREHINFVGVHEITVHLMGDTNAVMQVEVIDSQRPVVAPAPVIVEAPVLLEAPAAEEAVETSVDESEA